jgi:hypothetical protein
MHTYTLSDVDVDVDVGLDACFLFGRGEVVLDHY